jgi:hypothetical protein
VIFHVTALRTGDRVAMCDVHWMGPCPCRACDGRGQTLALVWGLIDCDTEVVDCLRCNGDGCDPDVRDDCEDEP